MQEVCCKQAVRVKNKQLKDIASVLLRIVDFLSEGNELKPKE